MRVNGLSTNNPMNIYNNYKKDVERVKQNNNTDTIQISSLGKSLSSYSVEGDFSTSNDKIEKLRNEVSKGTYHRDSKLVAQKMLDAMKEFVKDK